MTSSRPSMRAAWLVAARLFAGLVLVFTLGAGSARAQWPNDPAVNLAVADGPGEQVLPKIAGTVDGGCYVGWFDNHTGAYTVRLQRFDPAGVAQWPHNGILISDRPQDTMLTDWDLACDAAGNAALTFSDVRGGTLDAQAYLVSPAGTQLWGANGISLSAGNAGYEPAPAVCLASDGDLVFAWTRLPNTGDGQIMLQRISPAGVVRYAAGGIAVASALNEDPAMPDLVASLDGSVIVSWVRDISSFAAPRHIRARRFNADGTAAWPSYVVIFDAVPTPLGYAPKILSDGAGGVICGWHAAFGSMYSSLVQRVSAAGVESFAHNGVAVSTDAAHHHIDPTTSVRISTGEIFVFWNERNSAQNQWGIYGQRLSASGVRQWGNSGLALLPVNTVYKSYPRSVPLGDGAICLVADEPTGQAGRQRLSAHRLDNSGSEVWSTVPVIVSSVLSSKSRLPLLIDPAGMAKIAWEDDRNGTPDVYAQNLNANGTLGVDPTGAPESAAVVSRLANVPNPFHTGTQLMLPRTARGSEVLVYDVSGALVRRLPVAAGGDRAQWDGTDDAGHALPAGVYFYFHSCSSGSSRLQGRAVLAP